MVKIRSNQTLKGSLLRSQWSNFELLRALMHVIFTCKYEKDRIKNRGDILHFFIDFYLRSTSSSARQYLFMVPPFPAQPKSTAHLLQGVFKMFEICHGNLFTFNDQMTKFPPQTRFQISCYLSFILILS